MANKEENLVKVPETRVRRGPVEGRNKLNVKGKDPEFVYRVVNDIDDRVHDLMERGYIPDLSEDIRVGDSRIDNTSKLGKVREIPVGGGNKAILMKIKKEWHEEDQAAKLEKVKESEKAMRPNPNEGTYGKVDISRS
jgi:hypothetical protein